MTIFIYWEATFDSLVYRDSLVFSKVVLSSLWISDRRAFPNRVRVGSAHVDLLCAKHSEVRPVIMLVRVAGLMW